MNVNYSKLNVERMLEIFSTIFSLRWRKPLKFEKANLNERETWNSAKQNCKRAKSL